MREYHLQTARLGFGLWNPEEDLPLARQLWGDPEVCRYITVQPHFTEAQIKERLAREHANHQKNGVQYWPLFALQNGSFLGCCGLCPCEWAPGDLEFGIHLLPKAWGQGNGFEAGQAVLGFAKAAGRQVVWAGHHPDNDGSRALLRKLGFVYKQSGIYPPTGALHPAYTRDL